MYKLCLQNGMTALYVASHNGHVEVVNIVLQNGAHVDIQEEVSWTYSHSTDRAVNLKWKCKNMTVKFCMVIC